MSQSQSSLALEEKEDVVEPKLDLFVREKSLFSIDQAKEKLPEVIKVSGTITVSF